MNIAVAPSVLSADFSRLGEEVRMVEKAGADILHLDVMDAHFVPNITFGPMIVRAIRGLTNLPLDTHLMMTDPDRYLDEFVGAGSSRINFHLEAFSEHEREGRAADILDRLDRAGTDRAIAVNPDTPADWVLPYLDRLDHILIMTVYPGFGGQKLIPECLEKVSFLRREIDGRGLVITIGVDGGVNMETAPDVISAGADVLITGSAVFNAEEPASVIEALKAAGPAG